MTPISRREFLASASIATLGLGIANASAEPPPEPIIDIHQHLNYGGKHDSDGKQTAAPRTDLETIEHQRRLGITRTILLPAGRPCNRPSTHNGTTNGLQSTCAETAECAAFAKAHPDEYSFAANEVSDLDDAPQVIEKYLKLGAVAIAEQKFGLECDSPEMQRIYQLAADYRVPILMHWQYEMFNYGYERFDKMLAKYPKTMFIGHAQTFWAHIDKNYQDDARNLYPKGKVTPGGWTDRYLSNHSNFFGDLSADSGNNALKRDPDHTRAFFERHQNKLLFGSDCDDKAGAGEACGGWSTIQIIRRLSPSKSIERKLLYENARKLFRL